MKNRKGLKITLLLIVTLFVAIAMAVVEYLLKMDTGVSTAINCFVGFGGGMYLHHKISEIRGGK